MQVTYRGFTALDHLQSKRTRIIYLTLDNKAEKLTEVNKRQELGVSSVLMDVLQLADGGVEIRVTGTRLTRGTSDN